MSDFEQVVDEILEEYRAVNSNDQPSWWDLDEEVEARELETDQVRQKLCKLDIEKR